MSIRVVTLNLWGRSGAWEDRRSVLADGLRKLGADLLGPDYHVAHQDGRDPDGIGVSIASRWPATSTPIPTRPASASGRAASPSAA